MNWLANFVRPKIRAIIGDKSETPDNLWTKCPKCEHMLFQKDLQKRSNVCHHCQHHLRINVEQRLGMLFDGGFYTEEEVITTKVDPLKFKDTKKYADRLKEYKSKTGRNDSVVVAKGEINGKAAVIACFDFNFMGGSMGANAGQSLVVAAQLAVANKAPLIAITCSGGARMQEGIVSLMQMPRTVIAVNMVKEAGLPYITLLTDPTTGGVSASFAMLGDVAIAEPGAIIGFAGGRVIEETIRQKLPEGFQKAEYLLDHGMVDQVVHRHELKDTISNIIDILMIKKSQKKIKAA